MPGMRESSPKFIAQVAAAATARVQAESLPTLLARAGFTRLADVDLEELEALAAERVREAAHVMARGDEASQAARAELRRAVCAAMPAAHAAAHQVMGRPVSALALYTAADPSREPDFFRHLGRASREGCAASAARVTRALAHEPDVRVRGRAAALTFTPTIAPDRVTRVVNVDAALARPDRTFDWKAKITLMLPPARLLELYAVLRGQASQFASRGHGAAHDKWIALERQHDATTGTARMYCTVGQRALSVRAVPIGLADAQLVAALIAMQLRRNMPAVCSIADLDALAFEAVRSEPGPQRARARKSGERSML